MNPQNSRRMADGVKATVIGRNDAAKPRVDELTQFDISGVTCRLLLVDDVLPQHSATRKNARPRLIYAEGEIAHFDLGGHRYALVGESSAPDRELARAEHGVAPADFHALLTNRELQIVQLICMGCLTKQVADRLHLSEFTVRSYLKTIYYKLGVRSRAAMVYRYAQTFRHTPE
jgi:DNA-binding CsgD family transcriptional regulator